MQKNFKKRLAAVLSAVTAFTSVCMMDGTPAIQAAAKGGPYVSLRTAYKTLNVNETNKMTLKNNTIGWKITKISTEDRDVAMVYKKTASSFMIKGKSVGRTKVKARLQTANRKKYNSKLVKCVVNVVSETPATPTDPVVPTVPVTETTKSVATQAELDAALANKNLKKLTIETKEKQQFSIQAGDYSGVALTVKAPSAEVENNAKFQSVEVQEIAKNTWHENAVGNTLRISAKSARIIVGPKGQIRDISFTGAEADVKLVVNGSIGNVTIREKISIDISSDLDQKPTVPLMIDAKAQGTSVTAQIPLDLTVRAVDTVLNFQKGAEGSKVKAEVKTTVNNKTDGNISVTDANNQTKNVPKGGSSVVNAGVTTYQPSSPSYGYGGSSGSSSNPVTYYTVSFDGKEIRVQAGSKIQESQIPSALKRNGNGYKFSGWYFAAGKDENDNTILEKFDFNTVINKNIELVARWGMTEEDRILDIRGSLFVTSGAAVSVDLSRSHATMAIFDEDASKAEFVQINDTAITDQAGQAEVHPADGKLDIVIAVPVGTELRRFRAQIPMPAGAEEGIDVNLAGAGWDYYQGKSISVSSQDELISALADKSCASIGVITSGALKINLDDSINRSDVTLTIHTPNLEMENHATLGTVFIQKENCTWTEYGTVNTIYTIYHSSNITVTENAEVVSVIYNWGGEGNLVVNGLVKEVSTWRDREPEDTKNVNITISGTAANMPYGNIFRSGTILTTKIPMHVVVYEMAPHSVVNFEEGSANSKIETYVEVEVNDHSGGEIIVLDLEK